MKKLQEKSIVSYDHKDKNRANSPSVRLVTPNTVADAPARVLVPFQPDEHRRMGVKIIDDRDLDSLKIGEVGA